MGERDGVTVGVAVGDSDGVNVGDDVGDSDGVRVGEEVGDSSGCGDGGGVGAGASLRRYTCVPRSSKKMAVQDKATTDASAESTQSQATLRVSKSPVNARPMSPQRFSHCWPVQS